MLGSIDLTPGLALDRRAREATQELRDKLQAAVVESDFTSAELAEYGGVSTAAVTQFRTGRTTPRYDVAREMGLALDYQLYITQGGRPLMLAPRAVNLIRQLGDARRVDAATIVHDAGLAKAPSGYDMQLLTAVRLIVGSGYGVAWTRGLTICEPIRQFSYFA